MNQFKFYSTSCQRYAYVVDKHQAPDDSNMNTTVAYMVGLHGTVPGTVYISTQITIYASILPSL